MSSPWTPNGLAYSVASSRTGPVNRSRPVCTSTQAMPAPNRPCSSPEYRKGRRIKALVPPMSLMISISSRRLRMARRMVLPMVSSTASPSSMASSQTPRSARRSSRCSRLTHSRSSCTRSASPNPRSDATRAWRLSGSRWPLPGRITSTAGSGLCSSASRAPPKPDRRLNSSIAASGEIY